MLCKDARIYDRCCSYHDTAACWRPDRFAEQRYEGELFCGSNFRMSELCGAVMLAQFGRLDGLLANMRRNQKIILDGIKGLKGVTPRPVNDPEGDTGICIMLYLDSADKVVPFTEALQAEGVAASSVYSSGIPDWHIYHHWKHVIEKKTSSPVCCPYECPHHKTAEVEYDPDMCPKTLELLGRVVTLDVPPQMTVEDCEMIAKAIRKVAPEFA